jgi:hypothetical protein
MWLRYGGKDFGAFIDGPSCAWCRAMYRLSLRDLPKYSWWKRLRFNLVGRKRMMDDVYEIWKTWNIEEKIK